jgi:hypothetical protein
VVGQSEHSGAHLAVFKMMQVDPAVAADDAGRI